LASKSVPRYEIIPHTADIGVKAYGSDLKELFSNAAYAMFDIIADLDGLTASTTRSIEARAENNEELLVAWLDELLYHFYTRQTIFFDFSIITLEPGIIRATVTGRELGENRNRLKTEIKAVTYHELKIEETNGGFSASIIFDV